MSSSPESASDRIGALISQELLDCLEAMYPLRSAVPNPDDSERQVWMKVGERRLIDMLRARFRDTTE